MCNCVHIHVHVQYNYVQVCINMYMYVVHALFNSNIVHVHVCQGIVVIDTN